jgi:3-oxoadipate CoA-transferase beta subunit
MISRPTRTPPTPTTGSSTEQADRGPLSREEIARLVASDIPDGAYVNLGIGQPTKVAAYLQSGRGIILHTENGMLGMGPEAHDDAVDPDLINAGKIPVTELPGRRTSITQTRSP